VTSLLPPEVAALGAVIDEQAAADAAAAATEAEERVARLRAAATAEAEAIREAARRAGERRGRRRAAELVAAAQVDGRREALATREAVIDAAFEQARRTLAAAPAAAVVARLLREACAALPSGDLRVRLATDDPASLADMAAPGRSLHVEHVATPGTVVAETVDGRLRFDNSLATRLGRLHDELRRAVARVLFDDG
jgi:vacuolar-type H+-ATPase subunit E/Vma4